MLSFVCIALCIFRMSREMLTSVYSALHMIRMPREMSLAFCSCVPDESNSAVLVRRVENRTEFKRVSVCWCHGTDISENESEKVARMLWKESFSSQKIQQKRRRQPQKKQKQNYLTALTEEKDLCKRQQERCSKPQKKYVKSFDRTEKGTRFCVLLADSFFQKRDQRFGQLQESTTGHEPGERAAPLYTHHSLRRRNRWTGSSASGHGYSRIL